MVEQAAFLRLSRTRKYSTFVLSGARSPQPSECAGSKALGNDFRSVVRLHSLALIV